jgi:acyl carrier protein
LELDGPESDNLLNGAREQVEAAVFRAVDSLNETLAPTQQLGKMRSTVVVDNAGKLDSMAVVNLIVFIEDAIAHSLNRQLDLTGGDPFDPQDLRTLGSLIDALCGKLSD